jgi:hypothetical protein
MADLCLLMYIHEGVSKLVRNGYRMWNMWYSNLEINIYFSTYLHQHWYTCPTVLPVRRNPQHRSLLTVVSATSAPPFQTSSSSAKRLPPRLNRFMRQTLPTVNRKYFFMNIICLESFCPQKKTHNRTLLFSSVSSSTVAILTTETSLWNLFACISQSDFR